MECHATSLSISQIYWKYLQYIYLSGKPIHVFPTSYKFILYITELNPSNFLTRWPLRHATLPDNQTNITKTKHCRWWNVYLTMYTIDRWSFLPWFDVNLSTFVENISIKRFSHVSCDLDIWPLGNKFAPLFRPTLIQRYVSTKLEVFVHLQLRENQRYGTNGRTYK